MPPMPNEGRDAFINRYRRSLGLGGWIAGVVLTVVLYNVTLPRSAAATSGGRELTDDETIQVGALPVT